MIKKIFTRNNMVMFLYIIIAIFMIFARDSNVSQLAMNSGATLFGGVQRGLRGTYQAAHNFVIDAVEIWSMRKHYKIMQERIQDYSIYELQMQRLMLENEQLRTQLQMDGPEGYSLISARVLTRDPSNLANGFMIDRGLNYGIEPKMLVLAYNEEKQLYGVLGRVEESFAFSARVVPLNHLDFLLTVRVLPAGYEGLIEGGSWSGDRFYLNYISRNAFTMINVGDRVVTSTIAVNDEQRMFVMDNLYVGTISEVTNDPTLTALKVEVASIIDLNRVQHIFVLSPNDSANWMPDGLGVSRVQSDFIQDQQSVGL